MTKKDYELVANVFATTNKIWLTARNDWYKEQDTATGEKLLKAEKNAMAISKILSASDVLIQALCHEFKKDNFKFSENKFKKACLHTGTL